MHLFVVTEIFTKAATWYQNVYEKVYLNFAINWLDIYKYPRNFVFKNISYIFLCFISKYYDRLEIVLALRLLGCLTLARHLIFKIRSWT